jgi:hypothetical protein
MSEEVMAHAGPQRENKLCKEADSKSGRTASKMWITLNDGLGIRWKGAIVAYLKTLSRYLPGRN